MLRQAETLKSGWHRRIADIRKWTTLIDSGLCSNEHRYSSPAWEAEPLPRGRDAGRLTEMFTPLSRNSPGWLKDVSGPTARAPFYTTSPARELQPWLDYQLALYCSSRSWTLAGSAWLSMLLGAKGMLVWHTDFGDLPFFSLGEVCGCSALGWPAVLHEVAGERFWSLKALGSYDELQWFFVTDLEGWRATTVRWLSPAGRFALGWSQGTARGLGLAAQVSRPPEPLLRCAARECFFSLSKTALLHLSRFCGAQAKRCV